jgi:hypothetical protein
MRVDIIGSTISNGGLIYEQKKIDISRTYSCNVNRITCRMWRFFTEFITEREWFRTGCAAVVGLIPGEYGTESGMLKPLTRLIQTFRLSTQDL